MENKAIQIEPKAATEMQSWTNIYDRVPSQYRQYVSYPTTTMKECPSKAEINSKLTHACTTDSNELVDYSSITLNFSEREELTADSLAENWMYNSTTQRDIQLRYGTTIFKIILVSTLLKLQDSHNTLKCCSQIEEYYVQDLYMVIRQT